MKLRILLIAIVMTLLFAGTQASAHVRVHPRRVVIERGHVHTVRCGHYYYRNHWYFVPAHVHGPKCGHVLVNGVWVVR